MIIVFVTDYQQCYYLYISPDLNHNYHNVVADFGLTLMLTNMKLVNENSPKEMIILRIDCLRKGLSNFKLKMENDGKK